MRFVDLLLSLLHLVGNIYCKIWLLRRLTSDFNFDCSKLREHTYINMKYTVETITFIVLNSTRFGWNFRCEWQATLLNWKINTTNKQTNHMCKVVDLIWAQNGNENHLKLPIDLYLSHWWKHKWNLIAPFAQI